MEFDDASYKHAKMASRPQPSPLRPQPMGDRRPKSIAEFIERVKAERGGFRNVTEESLRQEMEAEYGLAEPSDVEMTGGSDGAEAPPATTIEDIRGARDNVLKNVE